LSDLSLYVRESAAFQSLKEASLQGKKPHAVAFVAQTSLHETILTEVGKLYLCEGGSGEDECQSCQAWDGISHPDLIMAGSFDRPPGIDDCRHMSAELFLAPVVSPLRLGVICAADRLSLPAANSLLKITEEPPQKGAILFLMEEAKLIPTLQSRVWTFSLYEGQSLSPLPLPVGWEEWLKLLSELQDMESGEVDLKLMRLTRECLEEGLIDMAQEIEELRLISLRGHLDSAMVADFLFALFEEGISIEDISCDLWQATLSRLASRRGRNLRRSFEENLRGDQYEQRHRGSLGGRRTIRGTSGAL
jgi:DNA polymerase-3 subunit delta'